MATTRKYMALLTHLAQVVSDTPKKNWDMSIWGGKTECGTVACLAGHAAMAPWFKRQGIESYWRDFFVKETLKFGIQDSFYSSSAMQEFKRVFDLDEDQNEFLHACFYIDNGETQAELIAAIKKEGRKYGYELTWSRS